MNEPSLEISELEFKIVELYLDERLFKLFLSAIFNKF